MSADQVDDRLSAAAVREGMVSLGKHRVFVREVPGTGTPVLLINGIGAHTRMWGLMERTLVGRHVVSFDAPGAGQSPTPVGPVSVSGLARLATQVLDHLGLQQVDAVGYSMGGIVLQQLLADHPDRVRRAVLIATSPGLGGFYGPATSLLNVCTPLRFLSDRFYLRSVGGLVGGRARNDRAWVTEHLPVRLAHRPSMLGYSQQVMSLAGWSGLSRLPDIPHPVLVIAGNDDPLTPLANGKLLAHLIPEARLKVAYDEGHLMPLDDQSEVCGDVRDFLAARTLRACDVWRSADVIGERELRVALKRQLQPLPWGAISALQRRRVLGARARCS